MMNAADCYASHAFSRLVFGFSMLFVAVFTHHGWLSLLIAVFSLLMIRVLDGRWLTVIRLLRLLRWFVIPIVLLHALFSPGQLLFPEFPVAVSREGVVQGIWLSLHLAALFAAAMLVSRLLRSSEWMAIAMRLPGLGERIVIQALMVAGMQKQLATQLQQLRQQFTFRRQWRRMPLLLITSFKIAMDAASGYAQALWLRWPEQLPAVSRAAGEADAGGYRAQIMSLLFVLIACMGFALPWL